MITIKTSELLNFFKRASSIKSSDFLPIYTYLKFDITKDGSKVCKSNGNSFIVHEIEIESKEKISFLIEEKILRTLVEKTSSKEITFEIKGFVTDAENGSIKKDNITFSDGLNKLKCQSPDAATHTLVPDTSKAKQILLPASVVESLYIAKTLATPRKDMKFWHSYVHIYPMGKKKSAIVGTDQSMIYLKSFDAELPTLALETETCAVLGAYAEMNYSKHENYNLFDVGNSVFGFIDVESKCADLTPIFSIVDKKINFIINRKELIEYCEICMSINPGLLKPIISIVDAGKNKVFLKYENVESVRSNERTIDVKKTGKPDDFLFQAESMVSILKNLSYETVQFNGPIKNNYYITTEEDEAYIGAIREVMFTIPEAK